MTRRRVESTGRKVSVAERKVPFFLISRQIIRGNKWTLALVILLMSVAFVNLVFVNSLFNGIVQSTNDQVIATTSGNITITPPDKHELFSGAARLLEQVRAVRGVEAASPRTFVPATLSRGEAQGSYQVQAVDPAAERAATSIPGKMSSGSYLGENDTNGIVLGRQLAGGPGVEEDSGLGVTRVGDTVVLNIDGVSRPLIVRGIFYTKYAEADRGAFINQKTLEQMMPAMRDRASIVLVKTSRKGGEQPIVSRLKAAGIDGTFKTWQQVAGVMSSVANSFVTINALLTTVGFIIAAVVIFIIVYVDISNKRRQIGILRAIGIKPYLVSSTYILQATIYSLVGVAVGVALFFGILIPYFKVHPFSIPIGDVSLYVDYIDFIWRGLTVVAVAIVSALVPALIATRRPILDEIAGR